MKQIVLWSAVVLFFASCASNQFSGTAAFVGRVCDTNGAPVGQYQLKLAGQSVVTSENGIFVISDLKAGTYHLTGSGRGWKSIDEQIVFTDRRGILCIQVEPVSSVYQKVESCLHAALYDEATALLQQVAEGNSADALFTFYEMLIAWCQSPSDTLKQALLKAVEQEVDYAL